ncbi:MAG TPA: D-alanine--D-alanine ligase [Candidatus Gastranaerophilaceae bacterium]|nr:D-alanine--D-alanine ligase [Candidatus Gastranaerophilaceae bacterium]HPT41989.1 D-alanine--D-alanine ligase [Candidatus Gastranaerophilaceae bacterium]
MQYSVRSKTDKNSKIAVLCGGMSSEREVSLRSGKNCHAALLRLGFKNAVLVDVGEDIAEKLKEGKFEIAYNALHGKYGEDGCIQGLLEILKIPYTGCGVMASAVCMNKEYTKKILSTAKIPLIKSVFIQKGEDVLKAVKSLKYPLMVKPVSEGSSFGMSKVENETELVKAVKEAQKYNPDVLIEEYLVGICSTVGVLDDGDKTFATEILELRPKNEWYDYEAKYTKGMTDFILPAEISADMTKKIKELAVKAHKVTGCSGVSRVDFHIVGDIPYVLEVNTSPGMTDTSDLPAQAACMGIEYDNLVLLILNSAGLNK